MNNNFKSVPLGTPNIKSTQFTPPKQNKTTIVNNLYRTILGRDPDSNALMYYISLPEIDENAVRKQMVESAEHKNILKEYKNIKKLKEEMGGSKGDIKALEQKLKDKDNEIDELNKLIYKKSEELIRMRKELKEQKDSDSERIATQDRIKNRPKDSILTTIAKSILKK